MQRIKWRYIKMEALSARILSLSSIKSVLLKDGLVFGLSESWSHNLKVHRVLIPSFEDLIYIFKYGTAKAKPISCVGLDG